MSPDSTLVVGMSRAAEIRDTVIELVQPLLTVERLTLVGCTVALSRGGLKVDLAVDREDSPADGVHGLNSREYSRLSRYLCDVLEAEMPGLGEFGLTVGSPGVNRRLESELELRWAVGKNVEIHRKGPGERLVGRLRSFDAASITVETGNAGPLRITRDDIAWIRLFFSFPERKGKKAKKH